MRYAMSCVQGALAIAFAFMSTQFGAPEQHGYQIACAIMAVLNLAAMVAWWRMLR